MFLKLNASEKIRLNIVMIVLLVLWAGVTVYMLCGGEAL